MKNQKTQPPHPVPELKPLLEQQEPEVPTFTEIGGSPLPGFTLRHILRGHKAWIGRIAWSPDGSYLASPSEDKTIRIWDARSGACVRTLEWYNVGIIGVAWSPDGQRIASASDEKTIRLWEIASGKAVQVFEGHEGAIHFLSLSAS